MWHSPYLSVLALASVLPGPPGESKMGNPGPRGVDGKSGIPGISGAAGQPGELGPPGLCDSSSGCHRGGHPPAGI